MEPWSIKHEKYGSNTAIIDTTNKSCFYFTAPYLKWYFIYVLVYETNDWNSSKIVIRINKQAQLIKS